MIRNGFRALLPHESEIKKQDEITKSFPCIDKNTSNTFLVHFLQRIFFGFEDLECFQSIDLFVLRFFYAQIDMMDAFL